MKMQVSGVCVVNEAGDSVMESSVDNSLNPIPCADSKNAFICSFDWSLMFEVEEKLLEIAQVYRKLAQGSSKVEETLKAAVHSCGSKIKILNKRWSSVGAAEIGVTCKILIDSVQVAEADAANNSLAEKAAFAKAASVLSRPCLQVLREPHVVALDEKETFPDDTFRALNDYRCQWRSKSKGSRNGSFASSDTGRVDKDGPSAEQLGRLEDNLLELENKAYSELNFAGAVDALGKGEISFSNETDTSIHSADYDETLSDDALSCEIEQAELQIIDLKQKKNEVSRKSSPAKKLSTEFALFKHLNNDKVTPASEVLSASARLCGKEICYCEGCLTSVCFCCTITLDGLVIGCAFGESVADARHAAVGVAIRFLQANCCTIVVKDLKHGAVKNVITPEKLLDFGSCASHPINPSGAQEKVPSLLDILWVLMTKYLRNPHQEELVFSPQLSQEIKTMICKEATTRGLIVSHCDGESHSQRYIVLSIRRSIAELLDYIRANGGETQRYVLIEPNCDAGGSSCVMSSSCTDTTASLSSSMSSISISQSVVRQPVLSSAKLNFANVAGESSCVMSSSCTDTTASLSSSKSAISLSERVSVPSSAKLNSEIQLKNKPATSFALPNKPLVALNSIGSDNSKVAMVTDKIAMSVAGSKSSRLSFEDYMHDLKKIFSSSSESSNIFNPSAFVIIKCESYGIEISPVTILNSSSKLCGVKIEYDYQKTAASESKCSIRLAGKQVGEATCPTEFKARCSAAQRALTYVSRVCPTITVKDLSTCKAIKTAITPSQLNQSSGKQKSLPGGVNSQLSKTDGKNGDGILKEALNQVFVRYNETVHSEDLIFSPSFGANDRTLINNEGQKLGLRWSSFKSGCSNQKQFIGLSHHRTPLQFVDFIRANGGETIRYKLVEAADSTKIESLDGKSACVMSSSSTNTTVSLSSSMTSTTISKIGVRQPSSSDGKQNYASVACGSSCSSSSNIASLTSSVSSIMIPVRVERQPGFSSATLNSEIQLKNKLVPSSVLPVKPLVALNSMGSANSKVAMVTDKIAMSVAVSVSSRLSFDDYMHDLKKIFSSSSDSSNIFNPSSFVIIKCESYGTEISPVTILNSSSKLCGVKIVYDYQKSATSESKCSIRLAGKQVGEATCPTEFNAKYLAADRVLKYLSRVCPTIILKDLSTCMEMNTAITPARLNQSSGKQKSVTGGAYSQLSKAAGENGDVILKKGLNQIFVRYSKTPNSEDLIFSPNFAANDRTLINNEAQKWGLRWSSFMSGGPNQKQFIGLSRHRTPLQFVDFIRANGGETIRYKLVEAADSTKTEKSSTSSAASSSSSVPFARPQTLVTGEQNSANTSKKSSKDASTSSSLTSISSKLSSFSISSSSAAKGGTMNTEKMMSSKFDQVVISAGGISSGPLYDECVTSLKKVIKCVTDQPRLLKSLTLFDLSSFVIIRLQSMEDTFSCAIVLDSSAELCGLRVVYEETDTDKDLWFKCSIKLAGKEVGESTCSTKFEARDAAAGRVVRYLWRVCPTIIVKDLSKCVEMESVITPSQVHRSDSVYDNDEKAFKKSLDQIFSKYCQKLHHEDLVFSPSFSAIDRGIINSEGQKWSLRWSNFGSGSKAEQFIGMSYHRTPLELVNFIRANGGETIRYKLVEATSKVHGVQSLM